MLLGLSALVLHGIRQPQSFLAAQGNALRIGAKFHDITLSREPQRVGDDGKPPEDEHIAPALAGRLVVRTAVQQVALHRAHIVLPLAFYVDQRPLPPAKGEVLQAGQLEKVFIAIHRHPMRVQVTPAGRASSSTVTA